MPSSEHPPYGMDRTQSPFGDGENQDDGLLSSGTGHRAPRSARDSPNNAAAVVPALRSPNQRALEHHLSGSGSRLGSGSGRGGASPPLSAAAVQRRLSDFNGSGSGFMSSSLSPSVSPRRTHQAAPSPMALPAALRTSLMDDTPTPSTVAALHQSESQKGQEEEQQQQLVLQPMPSHHVPSPPRRVLSPSHDQPVVEMERIPSAKSATDGANAAQPPTATTRRTVAFADSALLNTAPPVRQSSSGFTDPRASLLAASDSRTTQRPSDVSTQVAPLASDSLEVTVPQEEEAASVDTTLHVAEPAAATAAAAAAAAATAIAPTEAAKPNDALKKEGSSTSPHSRKTGAYAHLVIQKPFPSNATEPPCDATAAAAAAAAAGSAGAIPTMAGGDPAAEAQIRAAGTGNANLLPVFDRAKQALLSPGLGSALTPRLRHGRTTSGRVDGPHDLTDATPKSTSGRAFSTLITPLLRTPMWRQQSSGVNSPLVVDRAVLEEPARSPATFGDRLKEMHDDGAGVTTHMVWQTREGQTRCTLSPSFLLVAEHDRVCIHWYDGEEEVFETDHTYLNVVPGGRHSCYNSASTPNGTPVAAAPQHDGTLQSLEMQAVWNAPVEDGNRLEMSHALGLRAAGVGTTSTESTDVATVRPQLEKTNTKSGSTPLVIRVRTPRHGRVDSLSFADDTGLGGGGVGGLTASPVLARAGLRARRPASEVFLARDDDAAAAAVDSSRLLSTRSDANQREVNMFASSATPLVTGHSRQASANWMLQRSATRQSLGENYQSFTVAFPKPGDYYFVCSKHKRTMRLQVQVQSHRSAVAWRYILLIGAAVLVVALIVIVVVVLAYWMQHSTYLFGEKDTATYEQYLAFLDIHDLITMKLFPFLAVCILIILIVILAAIGWSVFRCFHPARQGAYTRGIYASTRRVLHLGTVLLTFALIVLLFVAFGLEMNVMNGVNELALSIGSGVTSTLNMYSTAVLQVNFVVNETSVLFPNISLPTDQIYTITREVSTLMNQIVRWTSFIEDIAQVAFRIIPIVIYLSMQLGLFAACLTIGAIILRFRKAAVATTWMLAASVGVFSLVCGIEYTVTQLFSTVYSSVVVLRDDPQDFGATLGLANDSFVSQLLSYCTISVDDVSVISKYVNEILSGINNTLDAEGQKEFSAVFQFVQDVVPNTLEALANYTDYIIANLDALQNILDRDGQQVNDAVQQNVVPLLKAALSVIQTFEGLVNCQVIRDIVAAAIPIFKDEVQNYNLAVFSFLLIVFGISFILLVFSSGATYALRHPRRTWCNMRTGRWFRFRYSYKTHLSTLMMGAETKARKKTVLQWLVLHTEPIMYQLRSTMLVCYSACALMFFDCILIVLFNEVSRGTRTSKMLQALSYLGCAVLFFLLLAALFRRAIIRRIFHICALLCAAACLGVSVSQAIVGYVYFGECLDHTRYETSSLTYGSPVYMTCSATYMGYNLEVAIYSTVIFLNSITLLVTLAIQIRYERHLKASFAHRHYIGVLSPLEKFFPWLRCIFVDYLFVKRIYHGLLIAVIVIFLILFAVLDIGQWSVIRGVTRPTIKNSDIVQVINPNVGCNGDSQYCDLRANEIIWACAHNAHSSLEDGFVLPNHYYNITHQLQAGIRSFMVDVWYDKINSTVSDAVDVYVCHTLCLVGRRLWRDIAREFKQFLDQYPEQVIMIIFEQYVNSSSLGEISDEVGLTQYAWLSDQVAPNFNPDFEWPTLRQLINKGQRALMYNDVMAYLPMSRDCPEWLYYSFDFQYENYYQTNSVSEWVCDIHRGWCTADPTVVNCDDSGSSSNSACAYKSSSSSSSSLFNSSEESSSSDSRLEYLKTVDVTNCTVYGADPLWRNGSAVYNAAFHTNPPNVRSKMSTMNHFITNGVGSPVQATRANQQQQVQSTTYMCSSTWNTVVNILAFDFWNIANPLGTIEAMNQNIARYGARYGFANEWSRMLFGTDTVAFDEQT